MKLGALRWFTIVAALLAVPTTGFAQEAVITGTVTDSTGGVLPGVTVTAVHEATGNTFVAVTDDRGIFRIPARVGGYRLTAELSGFTTASRSGITLLVGQTANVPLQMTVSGVAETVTVTSEAPLLDITTSELGTNVDPQQMSELPVQGRDWMTLALLAAGNRTNDMGGVPVQDSREDNPEFQTNMDGQQVTAQLGPGGQPRFSRDAIAEFQFVSNRFDATQGRSAESQVNAITKSGSNLFSGSFGSYFRDSRWSAEDPVLERVVPYKEHQYSGTLGGPIQRDRLHFFGHYEFDREPRTTVPDTPYPYFNQFSLTGTNTAHIWGARTDYQFSAQSRLMTKVNRTDVYQPFSGLGGGYPSNSVETKNYTTAVAAEWTRVLGNRAVNLLRFGYAGYGFDQQPLTTWSNHWQAPLGITRGGPRISFAGFSATGAGQSVPWWWYQKSYSVRNDFTYAFDRHNIKVGGEFFWESRRSQNCTDCRGGIDARNGTPSAAELEAWFPDPFNADTWQLDMIAPLVRSYRITVAGPEGRNDISENPNMGAWLQDDWRLSDRLTINLGVRYDLLWNAFSQDIVDEPWMMPGRAQDANNIQPRVGFAYQLADRTVVRGGAGLYYGQPIGSAFSWSYRYAHLLYLGIPNDGRANFVSDPFNNGGQLPTYEEARANLCYVNNGAPGCLEREGDELSPPEAYAHINRALQTSIGFQHQLGSDMSLQMDYAYTGGRDEKAIYNNANLTYDPATGVNRNFTDPANRVYPLFGGVGYYAHTGYSNYHGLQTVFTKRFSNRWQASFNYLLAGIRNISPAQPISGHELVTFDVAPDMGNEYGLAITDQRHRAVFNGIWQVGRGFQVSGIYFYGSGQRDAVNCGGDRRTRGNPGSGHYVARLCAPGVDVPGGIPDPAGTGGLLVPRNAFVGDPIHRVDVRFQQAVPLGAARQLEVIVEIFNLFNRANYGSYTLNRANLNFGRPNSSTNLAYAPRTMQLGFRYAF